LHYETSFYALNTHKNLNLAVNATKFRSRIENEPREFQFSVKNWTGSIKIAVFAHAQRTTGQNGPRHRAIAENSRPIENRAQGAQIWRQF